MEQHAVGDHADLARPERRVLERLQEARQPAIGRGLLPAPQLDRLDATEHVRQEGAKLLQRHAGRAAPVRAVDAVGVAGIVDVDQQLGHAQAGAALGEQAWEIVRIDLERADVGRRCDREAEQAAGEPLHRRR
jgi:hypothetical protein